VRPKRSNLAITALVCALIIALIFATSQRAQGPVQNGRRLGEWLLLLSPATTSSRSLDEMSAAQEAPTAIRTLGTNALPYLLQAITIDERPSRFRRSAEWLMTQLPSLRNIDPLRQWVYGYSHIENQRAAGALRAFKLLGPTAEPAIPALVQLANSNTNWSTTHAAICALEAIGPPAQSALVGIIETNRNPAARVTAIGCLQPGEHAVASVPLLIDLLRDRDLSVVRSAIRALGRIKAQPEVVVPALTERLKNLQPARPASGLADEELMLKRDIAFALDSFGDQSHTAVPFLIEVLQEAGYAGSIACQFMKTLVAITQDPAMIVPVLTRQLESTNSMLRSCSAMALADLGARGRSALPALTNALQHADSRQSVEYAIQQITSPPSIKVPLE
jgi:HEAT repeat protein